MGEFSPPPPPLFLSPPSFFFFSYPSNTSTRLWVYYIITKIHLPFQNPGSALDITPVRKMLVERSIQCALSCLDTLPCFSFNLAAFQDNNDKLLCEQLPSDKYNNSDQFVASKVFHHFSILVSSGNFCQIR